MPVLGDRPAFSRFSVNDPDKARAFYEETLGLRVSVVEGIRGSMLRPLIAWFTDPADNVSAVIQD